MWQRIRMMRRHPRNAMWQWPVFAPAKPAYMPSMAISWAQRLKRVFNIDVDTCRVCGAAAKVAVPAHPAPTAFVRPCTASLALRIPRSSGRYSTIWRRIRQWIQRYGCPILVHRHKPVCSAKPALSLLADNGVDRMPAGLKTAIGGKTGNKAGLSGLCAVICKRFRGARGEKQTKLTANGGGRDAKGCLFDLYSGNCANASTGISAGFATGAAYAGSVQFTSTH